MQLASLFLFFNCRESDYKAPQSTVNAVNELEQAQYVISVLPPSFEESTISL